MSGSGSAGTRYIEREVERVAERAIRESRLAGGAPLGLSDGLEAFLAAVKWSEPLVMCILAFHFIFIFTAVTGRRSNNILIGLLVIAAALVLSASTLNDLGNRHWRELGISQNYFDKYGVFISMLVSAPLMVFSFCIVIYSMVQTSQMLIKVKRKEVRDNRKKQAAANNAAGTGEAGAATAATKTTKVESASSSSAAKSSRKKNH